MNEGICVELFPGYVRIELHHISLLAIKKDFFFLLAILVIKI